MLALAVNSIAELAVVVDHQRHIEQGLSAVPGSLATARLRFILEHTKKDLRPVIVEIELNPLVEVVSITLKIPGARPEVASKYEVC